MEFPKLRPRPTSTMTCTAFRGLDRLPGASNRTHNKRWHMGWQDERNLSSDRWPRLSVRRRSTNAMAIDGNSVKGRVVAMCGGDHLILLDEYGYAHCNGHMLDLMYTAVAESTPDAWRWSINKTRQEVKYTVYPNVFQTWAKLPDLWGDVEGGKRHITIKPLSTTPVSGMDGWVTVNSWQWDGGASWAAFAPATYGVTIHLQDNGVPEDFEIYLDLYYKDAFGSNPVIIRSGANAILPRNNIWFNAVKLASGQAMTVGDDYGDINVWTRDVLSGLATITLTLCDIDGNAYSGVVAGATEPVYQEGYWLYTGNNTTELREWSVVQSTWVTISSTYIKIDGISTIGEYAWMSEAVRQGDTVKFEATDLAAATDPDVVELLNSWHYIYGAGQAQQGSYVIVAGILPSDTVTLSEGTVEMTRSIPQMDFVVEAQNRLWGCRYDESASINEIYASKLGDFHNWHVFQGLATDSWTASRGTAAPFTGAITLGGNPLFFREKSMEKVFPSSTGAHQIMTYNLEGVQKGSHNSMVIIDNHLFYKSRLGVCVYSGSLPANISEVFGDWQFSNATAARHNDKYVVCMTRADGQRLCMVYDTTSGDWHVEDINWDGLAVTWEDQLYYIDSRDSNVYRMDGADDSSGVAWYAETDDMAVELPEHKWISYMRIRFALELGATCRVYVSYDGGPWQRKASLHGNHLRTVETAIWPHRADHFRLRIEGTGGCEIQSISYRVERSQGGH